MTAFGVPRTVLAGENGAHRLDDRPASLVVSFSSTSENWSRGGLVYWIVVAAETPSPRLLLFFSFFFFPPVVENSVSVALGKMNHQHAVFLSKRSTCRGHSLKILEAYDELLLFYQKRRFDRSRYCIVPRCLDKLLPFRRKNALTALSSTLESVFNRGSVMRSMVCDVSAIANFAGSTFYVDIANFQVETYIFFFLSAGSCRGKRWSLLLNSFPSVLETGLEIPNPKGRRLPPFFFFYYYSSLTLAELKEKSLVYLLSGVRREWYIANLIYALARVKNEYLKGTMRDGTRVCKKKGKHSNVLI